MSRNAKSHLRHELARRLSAARRDNYSGPQHKSPKSKAARPAKTESRHGKHPGRRMYSTTSRGRAHETQR